MIVLLIFIAIVAGHYFLSSSISLSSINWEITGAALLFLKLVDTWTTQRFLKKGDREGNPVLAFLFKKIGFQWSSITSVAATILIVFFLWKHLGITWHFSILAVYSLVIAWNLVPKSKNPRWIASADFLFLKNLLKLKGWISIRRKNLKLPLCIC